MAQTPSTPGPATPASTTTPSLPVDASEPGSISSYSCLPCRQSKIKCDRRIPCSHCVKANLHCSFVAPVRGKRKRTKAPKESLHAKLKRYEEMLKSCGVDVDSTEPLDDADSEAASPPDAIPVYLEENTGRRDEAEGARLKEARSKLVTREGSSRYFESVVWSNLGDEFELLDIKDKGQPAGESEADDCSLFLEPDGKDFHESATATLQPSVHVLTQLKDIYVDRIDPLIKILHLPAFWIEVIQSLTAPTLPSKSLLAVISAFQLAAISTMKDIECQTMFGLHKPILFSDHKRATRRALADASFMSTSDPVILQAYVLFMVAMNDEYDDDMLFTMSGIAVRLARKMGLHRDGTSFGLSPFETEMRRRLWWHIVHMDLRISDTLGTRPSLDLCCGDIQTPLNVPDEDLHPDMTSLPPARQELTSITTCVIRCDVMEILRKFSTPVRAVIGSDSGDVRWGVLFNPEVNISKRTTLINEMKNCLESKYMRYCDPANPLHNFISIAIRASICRMTLLARCPQRFANRPMKIPQSERNISFSTSIQLLEYINLIQSGTNGLHRYTWGIGTSYISRTIVYVLTEAQHHKTTAEVNKAWHLTGVAFLQCPEAFQVEDHFTTGHVCTALGKWTLEAWGAYMATCQALGSLPPVVPEFIDALRHCRTPNVNTESSSSNIASGYEDQAINTSHAVQSYPGIASQDGYYNVGFSDFENLGPYALPDLLSIEMDPNQWIQWGQLAGEKNGYA